MKQRLPRNVAIVQPLPGIGDMIWHLPHIRAIAAHAGAPVTLLAKPRSHADELLQAEPAVRDVIWVDRNPEDRRGRHDGGSGWLRLVRELRRRRFSAAYILHHSRTLGFLMLAAGVPARHGYGYGLQRFFLNRGPYLPATVFQKHPFEQASLWLSAAKIPLLEEEPSLPVSAEARASVGTRLGNRSGPLVAIGVGSSESYKQWGADRFAALIALLAQAGWERFALVGGTSEAGLIAAIHAGIGNDGPQVIDVVGWSLPEVAALLDAAAYYVGNDTGIMNLAAAIGIPTYGLFGAVLPFHHSRHIVPITPPGGVDRNGGMAKILPAMVAEIVFQRRT